MTSLQSLYYWKWELLLTINVLIHVGQSIAQEKKTKYYGVPCVGYKPGEDDLQTLFDVISRYRLDFTEKQYPGVSRVRGTTRMQTAYRIDRDANLTLPTRQIFPIGLPQEFSFTSIFRTWKTPRVSWHIFQLSDRRSIPQFAVTLNPKRRTLDLTIGSNKYPQMYKFDNANIFDNRQWHKLQVAVFRETADVYVDCNLLGTVTLQNWWPIDLDGQITISQTVTYSQTVSLDLQWMIVDCDPGKPKRERCDELPSVAYEQKKSTCDVVCPQGPPGVNGTHGPRGFSGYPGAPGPHGLNGLKGEKGEIGRMGEKGKCGAPGSRGIAGADGIKGATGLRGLPGLPGLGCVDKKSTEPNIGLPGGKGEHGERGFPGITGAKGDRGDIGLPGLRGLIGLPGEPGPVGPISTPGQKGEPGRDGIPGLVSGSLGRPGQKGEPGVPGRDGYPGIKGDTGLRGPPGMRGESGTQGTTGLAGIPGEPGIPGNNAVIREDEIRTICRKVLRDELNGLLPGPGYFKYGHPGASGLPGPPGKPGLPGKRGFIGVPGSSGSNGLPGLPGDKGDRGDKGLEGLSIEGPPGPRGFPGPPGEYGLPGERGKTGRPGFIGKTGLPGLPGAPGICESCSNPIENYMQYLPSEEKG